MHAPVALMFSVLVSSINPVPIASVPRRKTGIWMRMRGDCRCCVSDTDFGCFRVWLATWRSISTVELVRGVHSKCHSLWRMTCYKKLIIKSLNQEVASGANRSRNVSSQKSIQFPKVCKWNVFTIDSSNLRCDDEPGVEWENFCHSAGNWGDFKNGRASGHFFGG